MSNKDDQSDEIMALQSIYAEDIFTCTICDKLYRGVVEVHVESKLKEHYFICNGHHIPLNYLSPVILNFSLPPNYPSECPPDVSLSCLWLKSHQLEYLSNILKDYWKESCSVVLWSWMDLIKTEIFKLLDVKFPIEISEMNFLKLTEFNLLREEEKFNNGFHFCPICFLEFRGTDCIRLFNCEHVFCKECLAGFLSVCIFEGNVKFLFCPAEECEEEIYPNEIKKVISEVEYEKYERLLLHKTLSIMQDIQYCPRPNCGKPVIVENDDLGFCHDCNFAFCIKCNSTYHGVDLCKKEREQKQSEKENIIYSKMIQKLEMAKQAELDLLTKKENRPPRICKKKQKAMQRERERVNNVTPERSTSLLYFGYSNPSEAMRALASTRKLTEEEVENEAFVKSFVNADEKVKEEMISEHGQYKIDDAVSESWISKNSRKCPGCFATIEKMFGCNHMTCGVCRTQFCWLCLMRLKGKNPYTHFSDRSSPCYNLLATLEA